jgi:lipoic acid synthetase
MSQRLPSWVINKYSNSTGILELKANLRKQGLHTVCESARCPNQGECFSKQRVTFLIMGSCCTRACRFCAVDKGVPKILDDTEPQKVAQACKQLELRQVVITSVTRDDLPDGGAEHFAHTVSAIRKQLPKTKIEVLTPDFEGNPDALAKVSAARPDVWGHNLETVSELYPVVRSKADYGQSLFVLRWIKEHNPLIYTKSGLMLGLGETESQIMQVLADLRKVDCDFLTIGQYLQPTRKNLPVKEYIKPEIFEYYREKATKMGFKNVMSQPLARSSYHEGIGLNKVGCVS